MEDWLTPFVVFALPRSRTFWASKFLTYGGWECGHDELRYARTMEDVRIWQNRPQIGSVETLGAPFWRLAGDARVALIRRPVADVIDSFARCGLAFDRAAVTRNFQRMDRKLDQIAARVPGAFSVTFDELGTEDGCRRLFEFCLPVKHDPAWWSAMKDFDLQVDIRSVMRYCEAYMPQLEKLAKTAKHHCLAALSRDDGEIEGVTIQEERFETFYRDGTKLFSDHLVDVGEPPDNYVAHNIPLLEKLDEIGALQIMTARSNGRMFGYLVSLISPSLKDRHIHDAMHTFFYASPQIRGVGMKLQRAAIDALRKRGIGQLFMRAGVVGDGHRMGAVYRRMGCQDMGSLHALDLRSI